MAGTNPLSMQIHCLRSPIRNHSLALVRFKILGEEVHEFINGLVQSILFEDTTFVAPPFFVVPRKPTNSVETVTLEDISAVKGTVVVDKEDITWFHGKSRDVLFTCTLDLLTILQSQGFHCISVEHLGHTNLGNTAWSAITQFASMVVRIVEPHRKSSHWMAVDGRFSSFYSLESSKK